MGLPWWLGGKESACSVRDSRSIPRLGRSFGGGHGNPLQYSCLENPHGQRSLACYSPWACKEWEMTKHKSIKKKNKKTLLPFLPPSILYVPVLWSHPCVCQHTLLFASLRRLCWAAETTDAPSSALPIDHPQRPAQMSFPPRSVMLPASRSLISALFPNPLAQLLTAPLY